jgi:hypothetical protein
MHNSSSFGRGNPGVWGTFCLQTNVDSGSLCLRGGEDPNDPPSWCYENVVDRGTCWRIDEERDDDKSRYKLHISQSGPEDTPRLGSSDWQQWNVEGQVWFDTNVMFGGCAGSIDANGISSSCYTEVDSTSEWIGSFFRMLAILGMIMAFVGFFPLCVCTVKAVLMSKVGHN